MYLARLTKSKNLFRRLAAAMSTTSCDLLLHRLVLPQRATEVLIPYCGNIPNLEDSTVSQFVVLAALAIQSQFSPAENGGVALS